MKKHSKLMAGTAMVLITAASGAKADTTAINANATVIAPIVFGATQSLEFGRFASISVSGTVAVNAAGTRSASAAIDLIAGGTVRAGTAAFTAAAQTQMNLQITVSTALDGPDTVADPTLGTIVARVIEDPSGTPGTALASGAIGGGQNFSLGAGITTGRVDVGGTITMPASAVDPGTYTGALTLALVYN